MACSFLGENLGYTRRQLVSTRDQPQVLPHLWLKHSFTWNVLMSPSIPLCVLLANYLVIMKSAKNGKAPSLLSGSSSFTTDVGVSISPYRILLYYLSGPPFGSAGEENTFFPLLSWMQRLGSSNQADRSQVNKRKTFIHTYSERTPGGGGSR